MPRTHVEVTVLHARWAAVCVLLLAACEGSGMSELDDAGSRADSGRGAGDAARAVDAGVDDAPGSADGGPAEGGPADGASLPDARVPPPDDAGTAIVATNTPEGCEAVQVVGANPGNEGAWIAARLTPPAHPFLLHAVSYDLHHGPRADFECDAALAHRALVFKADAELPPRSPDFLADHSVPGVSGPEEGRHAVRLPLDIPVRIDRGEHVFVAIQLAGTSPDVLCARACASGFCVRRNYFASSRAEPFFAWTDIASFDLRQNFMMEAQGTLEPGATDASPECLSECAGAGTTCGSSTDVTCCGSCICSGTGCQCT